MTTRSNYLQNDYAFITDVSGSGNQIRLDLDRPLTYYHFGSTKTDWSDHNGVDMRGEVLKLSRSIKILGEDLQTWGGQIVVQDFFDFGNVPRSGHVYLDSVQVYNCSQMDTEKAALRFERNTAHPIKSVVKNSAFHHGNGWGLLVKSSKNIEFENNIWFSFSTIGTKFYNAEGITLTGNTVAAVWERVFEQSMLIDPRAGFMIGMGEMGEKPPKNFKATNNKAIGVPYAGFVAPAQSCVDDSDDRVMFEGNYAHSVSGDGWVGYRNTGQSSQRRCA